MYMYFYRLAAPYFRGHYRKQIHMKVAHESFVGCFMTNTLSDATWAVGSNLNSLKFTTAAPNTELTQPHGDLHINMK